MSLLEKSLGYLADLVSVNTYVDDVPLPMRRRWNFLGVGWGIIDDPINEQTTLTLSGESNRLILAPQGDLADPVTEGAALYAFGNEVKLQLVGSEFDFYRSLGVNHLRSGAIGDQPLDLVCSTLTVNGVAIGSSLGDPAPNPDTTVKRTSTGSGRFVGLYLETDTGSLRSINAFMADATTPAELTVNASDIFLKGTAAGTSVVRVGSAAARLKIDTCADGGTFAVSCLQSTETFRNKLALTCDTLTVNVSDTADLTIATPTGTQSTLVHDVDASGVFLSVRQSDGVTLAPYDIACSAFTVNGSPVGGSGVEAPTPSTNVERTATGVGRFVGLTLETDTDGDRRIVSYMADGVTLESIAVEATEISLLATNDSILMVGGNIATYCDSGNVTASAPSGDYIVEAGHIELRDPAGAYSQKYTPVAAATLTYDAAITSLTDTCAQAGSGAGCSRSMLSGLGAAGSASGVCTFGLPDGNTVLGSSCRASVGTLVANVSDPFEIGTTSGGVFTPFLHVKKSAATTTLIRTNSDAETISIGGSLGASGNSLNIIPNSYVNLVAQSGYMILGTAAGVPQYIASDNIIVGKSNVERREAIKTASPTTATTTVLASWASTANKTFRVSGYVVIQNDTDTLSMMAEVTTPGLYRNVGGVITTLQAAVVTAVGDAGETSNVTVSVSFSGATVQLQAVTANAKTRKMTAELVNRVTV